jgi:hypothetical protein
MGFNIIYRAKPNPLNCESQITGEKPMADKTDTIETKIKPEITPIPGKVTSPAKTTVSEKTKTKRLSKSKRTHIRRMKAEARREGVVYRPGIE